MITPAASETAFLASRPVGIVSLALSNAPHTTYRVVDPLDLEGVEVSMGVRFEAGVLRAIHLSIDDANEKSWSDWSEAMELAKKESHDQLLADAYGPPPYRFPWGNITSSYDPRSGMSGITISYVK